MSLKVVSFDRLHMVSYQCSIVTLSIRCTVFEIFILQVYSDLETRINGHLRSSEPTRIDPPPMTSYYPTVSEIKVISVENDNSSHPPHPAEWVSLGIGYRCWGSKNQNDGATGPTKKFDNIFSRMDRMHERDGQTDGRTPGHSKDLAYAQRHTLSKSGTAYFF